VGVGDEIQTRQNDRNLQTETGRWVRNRQRWQVEQIGQDGSVVARGRGGRVTLPAEYAREHVELAYFQTVHSSQGLTRQQGGTLVDELSGWRSLYVGMTRGREQNTATWSSRIPTTLRAVPCNEPSDETVPISGRSGSGDDSPTRHDRSPSAASASSKPNASSFRHATKTTEPQTGSDKSRTSSNSSGLPHRQRGPSQPTGAPCRSCTLRGVADRPSANKALAAIRDPERSLGRAVAEPVWVLSPDC